MAGNSSLENESTLSPPSSKANEEALIQEQGSAEQAEIPSGEALLLWGRSSLPYQGWRGLLLVGSWIERSSKHCAKSEEPGQRLVQGYAGSFMAECGGLCLNTSQMVL